MKQKVSKRILSMLLAVVMIIGFVPTFNLTVLAGAVEADTLAGKTVITKVDLTIDMPTKYHDQMRGYDAGDETKVVNLYNSPFYTNNDKPKDVYQNGKLLTYEKLEAGVPAEMYIQLNAKKGDTTYAFDPEHPENVEIWVNGVKRDDAYIYIYPGNQWEYVDVVLPFTVEEYTGSTVNVTFDTEGLADVPSQKVKPGGYAEKPEDPVCDGKIFDGWYADAERTTPFDFYNTTVDSAVTIYGKWKQNVTKIDILLTDTANNPGEDALTDAMTGREGGRALKLNYVRGQGYYMSGLFDLCLINQELDQSDELLEAGRDMRLITSIYAEGENVFFDLDNLNDIEFWINGKRRTDVVIEEAVSNTRIVIRIPVNVVCAEPTYEEVIDSNGYTRYVSDWKGLRDVFTNLNEEAVEKFGKLRVELTKDLYTDEVYTVQDYFAKMEIPAGLDVVFDFGTHTIGGDIEIQRGDFPRHYYYPNDFLLFYLGKDSTLTFEAEESGGIRLNALQGGDDTFAAVRVMSDYPRAGRGASYPATFIVNGGSYILTCNADSCVDSGTLGHSGRYRATLYRGTVIADHVNVEINDGVFEVRTDNKGNSGRELTAFATVISKESLHLDKAPEGEYYPYVETGRTVINGGTFRAVGGGYAIHHFSFADIVINSKLDVPIENLSIEERQLLSAQENDYYHINYPTIRGGNFVGGLGFTGFTYTYSNGNGMLNSCPASDMLDEDCVGVYRSGDTERRDILDLTWKDLHDNQHLIVYSKTMVSDMTITPNGGWDDTKDKATKPYEVQEGDEVTFKVSYSFTGQGEYSGVVTWTVDPADPGYESYSKSGDSITISFAEKAHLNGITLKARILVNTTYGQVIKTVELPVEVQRKVNILTYTPNLAYDGPEYVMDGESFYFYIREKDYYELDESTLVVSIGDKVLTPQGDGRYIVNNVKRDTSGTLQINATAETRGYSLIKYVFGTGVIDTAKVYKGESLTLPTLKSLGIELPRNMKMDHWSVSGYGKYQPGDTIKITTAKEITVTAVFESYYAVQMQDGALAYSDEEHTKLISNAKENDYIYITAPEVEGKQFYMWKYELLDETYQRPYFGDVGSTETWVMMPPSGIILTPTYVTPIREVTIYGVTKPVAGEEFSYHFEDSVRETDQVYKGSTSWYHVVDGEDVEITYQNGVIFEVGETYRYTVLIGIPMSAEGVYGFPLDANDINVIMEGIPASAYTLTKEFSDQWHDYVRVSVEFTVEKELIDSVSATITLPTAGSHPVESGTPGDSSYTIARVHFYDDDRLLDASDTFEAGKTYEIYVHFLPNIGYAIDQTTIATINGMNAAYWTSIVSGADRRSCFCITYTVPEEITNISVTVSEPVAGGTPNTNEIVLGPAALSVSSAKWYSFKKDVGYLPVSQFTAGNTYTLMIGYDVADGYAVSNSASVSHDLPGGTAEHISSTKTIIIEYKIPEDTPSVYTVSGTVTSFGDANGEITIQLIEQGLTEPAYETVVKGNTVNYSFASVAAGTYTMKVSKANHVTREYTVVVGNTTVIQDVKIHLKGDITGDGRINIMDVNRANLHFKKKITLTGYEFDCANVTGDAQVNIMDVNRLNLHFKGKSKLW